MRKLVALLFGLSVSAAPAGATTIFLEKNLHSLTIDNGVGGNYEATATKTLFTFKIEDSNPGGMYADYIVVYPDGGFPTVDNLWLQFGCVGFECIGPLSAVVETKVGVTYNIGMTVKDFDYSDLPIDNLIEISAQAVVPEPPSWAFLLSGFGLLGMLIRLQPRWKGKSQRSQGPSPQPPQLLA